MIGIRRSFIRFASIVIGAVLLSGISIVSLAAAQPNDDTPSCAIDEMKITGQAWMIGGGNSGFSDDVNPAQVIADGDFEAQANFFVDLQSSSAQGNVVIFIVDDFSLPVADGFYPHGVYVEQALLNQFNALPSSIASTITVERVDVGPGYTNTDIVMGIESAVDGYSSGTRFVLNMSFVLMPCVSEIIVSGNTVGLVYEDFINRLAAYIESGSDEIAGGYSLVTYVTERLVEDYGQGVLDGISREIILESIGSLLQSYSDATGGSDLSGADKRPSGGFDRRLFFQNELDALRVYLQSLPSDPIIIPIASAGNLGRTIYGGAPFAPGSWQEVISVSAHTSVPPVARFPFSNAGEIMAPGGWYPFVQPDSSSIYGAGTSFAAPIAALFAALELTERDCTFNPLRDNGFSNAEYMPAMAANC